MWNPWERNLPQPKSPFAGLYSLSTSLSEGHLFQFQTETYTVSRNPLSSIKKNVGAWGNPSTRDISSSSNANRCTRAWQKAARRVQILGVWERRPLSVNHATKTLGVGNCNRVKNPNWERLQNKLCSSGQSLGFSLYYETLASSRTKVSPTNKNVHAHRHICKHEQKRYVHLFFKMCILYESKTHANMNKKSYKCALHLLKRFETCTASFIGLEFASSFLPRRKKIGLKCAHRNAPRTCIQIGTHANTQACLQDKKYIYGMVVVITVLATCN